MAIKTKVNEFIGKIVGKMDVSTVLVESVNKSQNPKTYKIDQGAKLGPLPNVVVAQAIIQKTGIQDRIPKYSDSLDTLLTNYLSENLDISKPESGKLNDSVKVEVNEPDDKNSSTRIVISNEGTTRTIEISENGSRIEITQEPSKVHLAKSIVNSSKKEQVSENDLYIKLYDDSMNVTQHKVTAQKTDKIEESSQKVYRIKSESTSYIESTNSSGKHDVKRLYLPSSVQTAEFLSPKSILFLREIVEDGAFNFVESATQNAQYTFENLEKLLFLKPYNGPTSTVAHNFIKDVHKQIIKDYSDVEAQKSVPMSSDFTMESFNTQITEQYFKSKDIRKSYTPQQVKNILKYHPESHFTFTQEALDNFGTFGHAIIRALTSDKGKVSDNLYDSINSLINAYSAENLNPNQIKVTTFGGIYDSCLVHINNESKVTKYPSEYSVSVEENSNGKPVGKESHKSTTLITEGGNYRTGMPFFFSITPSIYSRQTFTEVKECERNFILSERVSNPYPTEMRDEETVFIADPKGREAYQVKNLEPTKIIVDSFERTMSNPYSEEEGIFDISNTFITDTVTKECECVKVDSKKLADYKPGTNNTYDVIPLEESQGPTMENE